MALSRAIGVGAAVALIATGWLALQDAPASAEEGSAARSWFVTELKGAAFVRSGWDGGEQWESLRAGARIAPGTIVRTDETGRLVLENGVDRIQVAANSQVELPASRNGDPVTRVIHWVGSAFFEVGKRQAPQFEVTTPYLVAIVKGTKFTTEVSDAGAAVKVTEGIVGVSAQAGGPSTEVTAGQSVSVSAGDGGTVTPGDLSGSAADGGQAADADAGNPSETSGSSSDSPAAGGNPTARGAASRGGKGNGHDNSTSPGSVVAAGNGNGDGPGGVDDDGGDGDGGGNDGHGHGEGCPDNGGWHSSNGGRRHSPPHGNW